MHKSKDLHKFSRYCCDDNVSEDEKYGEWGECIKIVLKNPEGYKIAGMPRCN